MHLCDQSIHYCSFMIRAFIIAAIRQDDKQNNQVQGDIQVRDWSTKYNGVYTHKKLIRSLDYTDSKKHL
jgi:hypothetical protein